MTPHADLLVTFALIFAALAGFAGVVAAAGRFRAPQEAPAYRARFIVGVSVLGLLAALVPLVFDAGGLPPDAVNRLAASFLASGGIAAAFWDWQRPRPPGTRRGANSQPIIVIERSIAVALVAALFAVGAGFLPTYAAAVYLAALFYCTILCAFYFFMLVLGVDVGGRS